MFWFQLIAVIIGSALACRAIMWFRQNFQPGTAAIVFIGSMPCFVFAFTGWDFRPVMPPIVGLVWACVALASTAKIDARNAEMGGNENDCG